MPQQFEAVKGYRGLRQDVQSKIIYCFRMVKGINFRFSTRFKDPLRADRKANQFIADYFKNIERERLVQPLLKDTIADIIKRYEKVKTPDGKKNHTLNTVRSSFDKIEKYWGEKFPHEISSKEWDKFQDWFDLHYPAYNSYNVTKYMRVLKNHCMEHGHLRLNPTIRDRNREIQKQLRDQKKDWVYTDLEIKAIHGACQTLREKLIVHLGEENAFRIEECCSLEWPRIFIDAKIPHYKFQEADNKSGFTGIVPLSDRIVSLIRQLPRIDRFVFPQKRDAKKPIAPQQFDYQVILERAQIQRGTFHSLRHYRLSEDFKNPKFTFVQVCLVRRVSFETAKQYTHISEGDLIAMRNSGVLAEHYAGFKHD